MTLVRSVALATLLAAPGWCAATQARGQELATTRAFEFAVEPIGFDGPDVIAVQDEQVLRFGAAGRQVVFERGDGIGAVAGGGLLAVVRDSEAGPDELLFGPLAGPLRSVLTCRARGLVPPPVLAGARVVWPACDQRSLVVASATAQLVVGAGGELRAVAADGDRVAWIAADDAEPENLTVHTLDLAGGAIAQAGTLGTATGGGADFIRLAVAADGRLRATVDDLTREPPRCRTLDERRSTPSPPRAGRCAWQVVFTPEGSVESQPGDAGSDGRIVRRDRAGVTRGVIARSSGTGRPRPFATDGHRIAISLLTCRGGARLVAGDLATARFAKPPCPIRPLRRVVTASRSGLVRIPVRCPQGCIAVGGGMDLRLGKLGLVSSAESLLDVRPGGRGRIAFRLDRAQRRGLARARRVSARVNVLGGADRVRFAIVLRAP